MNNIPFDLIKISSSSERQNFFKFLKENDFSVDENENIYRKGINEYVIFVNTKEVIDYDEVKDYVHINFLKHYFVSFKAFKQYYSK